MLALAGAASAEPDPLPEVSSSPIGYATVESALAALRSDPRVKFREQGGWLIANDESKNTIWSFAPQGNAAYPAAVKRTLESKNGSLSINMSVLCKGSKSACDQLVQQFMELNERVRSEVSRKVRPGVPAERPAASTSEGS